MKPLSLNAVTNSSAVCCLLPGRTSFLNLEKSMTGILKVFALAAAVASRLLVMTLVMLRAWLRAGMRSNVRRANCYMTVMMMCDSHTFEKRTTWSPQLKSAEDCCRNQNMTTTHTPRALQIIVFNNLKCSWRKFLPKSWRCQRRTGKSLLSEITS